MNEEMLNLAIETVEEDEKTVVKISIDGVIGRSFRKPEDDQNTKQVMREQLKDIAELEADKIEVSISSLGGNVDHGLAILDLLAENDAEVTTKVTGMTASAATIIAQAGDTRTMSDNALYLIHKPMTRATGNENQLFKVIESLQKTAERISNIYAKRSDEDEQVFIDLMEENEGSGKWIDADEALEYGLIDEVYEPMEKAAYVSEDTIEDKGLPTIPENKVEMEDKVNGRELTFTLDVDFDIDDFMDEVTDVTKEDIVEDEASIEKQHRKAVNANQEFLQEQRNKEFINNEYFKNN